MNLKSDGEDHINAYSKSKCDIGRKLSNFYECDLKLNEGDFKSLEGYWFYLLTNDMKLSKMHGIEAKRYGESLERVNKVDDEFKRKFIDALRIKINTIPNLADDLKKTLLPITHYYVSVESGKRLETGHHWFSQAITDIRSELQRDSYSSFFDKF